MLCCIHKIVSYHKDDIYGVFRQEALVEHIIYKALSHFVHYILISSDVARQNIQVLNRLTFSQEVS